MNHDYAHCLDLKKSCPKSCFRAQLTREVEERDDLKGIPLTWTHFKGTNECRRGRKKMSYESPIDVITTQFIQQLDDRTFRAVLECGVHVDKDQLIKALAHDRGQYEKGYADGVNSVKEWIPFSERQPDTPHVLITVKWGEDNYDVLEEDWWCGEYEIEHGTAMPIVKEMHKKATAWMPMPNPYERKEE